MHIGMWVKCNKLVLFWRIGGRQLKTTDIKMPLVCTLPLELTKVYILVSYFVSVHVWCFWNITTGLFVLGSFVMDNTNCSDLMSIIYLSPISFISIKACVRRSHCLLFFYRNKKHLHRQRYPMVSQLYCCIRWSEKHLYSKKTIQICVAPNTCTAK